MTGNLLNRPTFLDEFRGRHEQKLHPLRPNKWGWVGTLSDSVSATKAERMHNAEHARPSMACSSSNGNKIRGHVHMTSAKILGFLTPPPLVCILDQFIVLNSRNLPYYICFWGTPLPPSHCRHHMYMPPDTSIRPSGSYFSK